MQKRSNTASQPSSLTQVTQDQNHRNTSSYHPDNNERSDQFNNIQSKNFKCYYHQPYKKNQLIIVPARQVRAGQRSITAN